MYNNDVHLKFLLLFVHNKLNQKCNGVQSQNMFRDII